jgi:hypothetical protein
MSDSPYFQSANAQIDTSKKGLLDAVAQAGTAGKAAFDAAQAQIAQQKQDAVTRAAQRSALGIGGNNDTFLSSYDARAGQLGSNQAGFQAGLAQTQASGDSYLEKARGGMGALEAVNINKGQDAETKIKLAIQAAQAKAQAAAQAQAAQDARANAAAARADARSQASSDRADARAAATRAAKPLTSDQLLGTGKALADTVNGALHPRDNTSASMDDVDNAVFAANQLGGLGPNTQGVDPAAAARAYAKSLGMDDATINSILTPSKLNTYSTALTKLTSQPATPDVKWLKSNVPGMDDKKAQQSLAAPEFAEAGRQVLSYFAVAPVDGSGKINDGSPYNGMSPKDAFHAYVYSQPGNLTMKEAAVKYYGAAL